MAHAADHIDRLQAQWARELPDLDTCGMEVLGRARRIVLRSRPSIEAVFAKHGLDAGEFDVLSTLRRSGPPYALRPTELYRSLMISSGGLTDRLNRLAKAGMIIRPASPDDGRSLLVQLTDKGRTTVETAFREDMAVEAAMLAPLDAAERRLLADLLRKLALGMEASPDGPNADG
ncbi:MarR family winged helix-turn-helix transcriptional regulator [Brevundimonas sp.]|uniref:MarR family winged helix-turn-helix transcriptional regulator n=1 Tax=Brevundimonas sp. TaxID=1871086 RepID=UPI002737DC26|nr:MarR family transcriptional regulator [Brevundimonas sp.]MDP3802931.1 MarR family transcriptional regulator [Brevundimonas sp.]